MASYMRNIQLTDLPFAFVALFSSIGWSLQVMSIQRMSLVMYDKTIFRNISYSSCWSWASSLPHRTSLAVIVAYYVRTAELIHLHLLSTIGFQIRLVSRIDLGSISTLCSPLQSSLLSCSSIPSVSLRTTPWRALADLEKTRICIAGC